MKLKIKDSALGPTKIVEFIPWIDIGINPIIERMIKPIKILFKMKDTLKNFSTSFFVKILCMNV